MRTVTTTTIISSPTLYPAFHFGIPGLSLWLPICESLLPYPVVPEVGLLLKYQKKNVPSAPHHSLTQIARGLWESNWTKPLRISKVKNYEIYGYNIKKIKMHVLYSYILITLCFYSYSKLNLVNFEQPMKHIYLEKFIFRFLWLLSALGKFKHLVTLAKVFTILLLSKCSSQWPMVFRYTSFCWLKKKSQTTGYPSLLLCASTGFNAFLCYY